MSNPARDQYIELFTDFVDLKIQELDQSIIMPVVEIRIGNELGRGIQGDEEIDLLKSKMLTHSNFHVRRGALKALRVFGAKRIEMLVPLFFEFLDNTKEHAWNRYEAAWAISDSGDPRPATRAQLKNSLALATKAFPQHANVQADTEISSSDAEANLIKRLHKSLLILERHGIYGESAQETLWKEFSFADGKVQLTAPIGFVSEEMVGLAVYLRHPEVALISYRGTLRDYPEKLSLKDSAHFNQALLFGFGTLSDVLETTIGGKTAYRFEGPQFVAGADTWQVKIYADLGGQLFQLTLMGPRLSKDLWRPHFERSIASLKFPL